MTKQSETRDRVFDLIDRLGVGEAIPSERQLSADLGVSRMFRLSNHPRPIVGLEGFLRHIVVSRGSNLFWIWMLVGGVGAALVFAATVVSVPLLLDRRVTLHAALVTSVRAVGANPFAMALWAAAIMVLTALSMATAMVGFAFAIPVIGHASWHAYRDVVDVSSAAPRDGGP